MNTPVKREAAGLKTSMSEPTSIAELDLNPIPGKEYWNCPREWREEFIYFLMVDRFHDDRNRSHTSAPERSSGSGTPGQLKSFCGGTIKGITNNLGYIWRLGCTALWLSPVFENNDGPNSYHGYAIQNYLDIDRRFGTKEDLIELVDEAHKKGMRVFLDIVLNHSGDNWAYAGGERRPYEDGKEYEFGYWRREDRPRPIELRDPAFYHRRGEIRNWDSYPETQHGDFFSLKDFNNDEDPDGLRLQDILIQIHCWWIRELDIDGFRVGAVKHMGELAVTRFCSAIRQYAYRLGKREFFLFGELGDDDDAIVRYAGRNTKVGNGTVGIGLDSVFDFRLYFVLPGVIKGLVSPLSLMNRYEVFPRHPFARGEFGDYMVTFIDNHDLRDQHYKRRFAADSYDEQVIAAVGYLLCTKGVPCIYYGTEQGFSGKGEGDWYLREAMFDLDDAEKNYLNEHCMIFREIAEIARIRREVEALRFGEMYLRQTSEDGSRFAFPLSRPCTLAASRILFDQEVLIAYNTSIAQARQDCVIVDSQISRSKMRFLYGGEGEVGVLRLDNGSRYVRLTLEPMQFVVLHSGPTS